MFVLGGVDVVKEAVAEYVYEVVDCGLKETSIKLPWALTAHSCASTGKEIFICGSEMDLMDKNCTMFDGKKFHTLPSTPTGHVMGQTVNYDTTIFTLGGKGLKTSDEFSEPFTL